MEMFNPPHPGEILREYIPEGMSLIEAAKRLGVTRRALSVVLNGRTGVSADMALRLSGALGTRPDFWLRLQMQRDLWVAKQNPPKRVAKLAA